MPTPISNISLKFPCPENWDQFEIVPGGRLCQSCAHIVKDFRDCSSEELNTALKTESKVCGMFNREQLSATFLKAAVVAISATTLSACETQQQSTPEPIDITEIGLFAKPRPLIIKKDSTTMHYFGMVAPPAPDFTK